MDRLDAMRVFIEVAGAGSLSAAARRLGVPLTTVSRKVMALEEHVGVRLITRTTRRLALTEPGRRYLEACRRVILDLDEAEASLLGEHGAPRGELALTAPAVFGRLHVLPVVAEFLRAFPQVDVRLLLLDRTVDLIDEGQDVAVRIGELPDSSLIATRVGAIRRIVCASPAYLDARGVPRVPGELAQHDCITFTAVAQPDRWAFAGARGERPVPVHSRLVVNGAEAAVDTATAGLGITRVLSYQAADAIAAGALRVLLEDFEPPAVPVSLVHREARFPPARVRSFMTFAAPRLRQKLGAAPVA
ncbi:MAG TPA: LysR family transcriptional regulator [Geminicoccaceae bacterium]|nr:LysR family transcriptional regulator [Geminicoccaceae bacterium]